MTVVALDEINHGVFGYSISFEPEPSLFHFAAVHFGLWSVHAVFFYKIYLAGVFAGDEAVDFIAFDGLRFFVFRLSGQESG